MNLSSSKEMLLWLDTGKAFRLVPSLTRWTTYLSRISEAQGVTGSIVLPVGRLWKRVVLQFLAKNGKSIQHHMQDKCITARLKGIETTCWLPSLSSLLANFLLLFSFTARLLLLDTEQFSSMSSNPFSTVLSCRAIEQEVLRSEMRSWKCLAVMGMLKRRAEYVKVNTTKSKYVSCSLIPNFSILNKIVQTNF